MRTRQNTLPSSFLSLCLAASLLALSAATLRAAPTSVLPSTLVFSGGSYGTGSVVAVTPPAGATFTQAWDVHVTSVPTGSGTITVGASTTATVNQGDALVATIYYRRTDGNTAGEANVTAYFDEAASPFQRSVSIPMRGRLQWRKVEIPFIAAATGLGHFYVDFGAIKQEVQIGGVQLIDYQGASVLTASPSAIDGTGQFNLSNMSGTWGTVSSISVANNPFFTTAKRVTTAVSPGIANGWELQLNSPLAKGITAGHTLVAIFWLARDPASNQGNMGVSGFKMQQAASPFTNMASYSSLMVDGNWKQFRIPFTATATYPANGSQFQLWFGSAVQQLDVGGIQIIDLGTSVAASDLTSSELDYPGRLLSDAWRADADARIQQYRTGPLTVNVQNASGGAYAGITVGATLQTPKFGFGTEVEAGRVLGDPSDSDNAHYQNALSQYSGQALFNKVNMANYKWPTWEAAPPSNNPLVLAEEQAWFRDHGIFQIRAHNLIWPNYRISGSTYEDVPGDVPALTGSALASRVLSHIDDEVGDPSVRSFVTDWDVVNEPWSSRSIQAVLSGLSPSQAGQETVAQDASAIAAWLAEVALPANDPVPYRIINESGAENNSLHLDTTLEDYDYNLLSTLLSGGAKLDGFGFESHFNALCTPPVTAKAIFDRFAALTTPGGKPLVEQVTEYDTLLTDPVLEADYLADYLTLAFSEPNFTSFTLWGFWATDFPQCPLYDAAWNLTPMGEAWKGLVYNKWRTNGAYVANASGVATANGAYLGRYSITVSDATYSKKFYADLPSPAGATVNVKLAGTPSSSPLHVWIYEPENAAAIYPPFSIGTDPAALNGAYVVSGTGGSGTAPSAAQMRLDLDAFGTVNIWVRVIAPNPSSDSLWAQIDDGTWQVLSVPDGTAWHWYKWTQTTLATGVAHQFNLAVREPGIQLDQVLVTDDLSYTPSP